MGGLQACQSSDFVTWNWGYTFYASGQKVMWSVQGLKDASGELYRLEKRKSWPSLAYAFFWEQFCSELSFKGTGIILH